MTDDKKDTREPWQRIIPADPEMIDAFRQRPGPPTLDELVGEPPAEKPSAD